MHCPRCNAVNPDDAKFCSLCLQRMSESKETVPEEQMPIVGMPDDAPEIQRAWEMAQSLGPPAESNVVSGPIRKTQEGISWFCPSCDTENPISGNRCRVCGSTIFDAFRPPEAGSSSTNKSANIAGLLSVIPGAGHLYLGSLSEGLTRILLGAWWFGTSFLLPSITPILLGTKLIFILASVALAGLSVFDAYRLADDPKSLPLFERRLIFFGSLGLFILTVVAVVSTGIALRG